MASIFTTSREAKIKTSFGKGKFTPFYLQFVPGVCVDSITSNNTLNSYNDQSNVNSILAIPHIRNKQKKRKSNLNNNDRYFPLMRGMFEVPAKGDPVLLCTIGSRQYYLGPLNTDNNPNFNGDNLREPETNLTADGVETNSVLAKGESLNFQKANHNRMIKEWNEKLDGGITYNETHGDMMLEGRHGNSLRIGSRAKNPYIIISNGRQETFFKEGFTDGTLISIINRGSLNQHFGGYAKEISPISATADVNDPNGNLSGADVEKRELEIVDGFVLASDYVSQRDNETQPTRLMGDLIKGVNGVEDAKEIIYDYGKDTEQNQVLISSERITLNSKLDDIYLSSNKDIHVGTKRHLTISTNENFIIESENVFLGNPLRDGEDRTEEFDKMVMGKKLQQVLKDILGLFKEIKVPTMLNAAGTPSLPLPSEQSVSTAIDKILSNKYFLDE
tara:strand:+ start:224 stop:1561 length:1338 start_codon:yes stop_codon:yes gene_type:complete